MKLIISDSKLKFDDNIYLTGNGLDKMVSKNNIISEGFLKAPGNKFKFEKQKGSDIYNESILNFFSDTLEILIKEEKKEIVKKKQIYRGQKYEQKNEKKEVSKKKQNSLTYRGKDKTG